MGVHEVVMAWRLSIKFLGMGRFFGSGGIDTPDSCNQDLNK